MENLTIRQSARGDIDAIETLYPKAFPDEDLLPVVRGLLLPDPALALSLVAARPGAIFGHIAFSECRVEGSDAKIALLAPLAVAPDTQRRGVGSALIEAGMKQLRSAGFSVVCVLGDPAYYSRFGFETEAALSPPYPLPAAWREAWRSKRLSDQGATPNGALLPPPLWRKPSLWGPAG